MRESNGKFAFFVLVFNHEHYIIEHLESIKYLIENHGANITFDIVINDDCSRDSSKLLIDRWLESNSTLFRNVDKLYNPENIGTCKSIVNMIKVLRSDVDSFKMTAGDDIYSFENIFAHAFSFNSSSIVSGVPLHFSDRKLYLNLSEFYGMVSSQYCYEGRPLLQRFKYLSVNNAPNIIYKKELMVSNHVLNFLSEYDVVEDWPIQIAISEVSPDSDFKLVNKVFVYYRRTSGSVYIVANKRFVQDKLNIYNYLISSSNSYFEKLVLINRAWLFNLSNRYLNKIFNLSFYIFSIRSLFNLKNIFLYRKNFSPDISLHNSHLDKIKRRADDFMSGPG
ncbi:MULTISPECIES: glycosyltransferase family A protein [unclassified Arsukibacterium]|uniref:glycosyltransferase family A protein n=1 Tax=unclassified Arsukibacterium TaxID=2635278 RepID=UPI000C90354B|nr:MULTISPECIES: glycosyltransferase family A protein [unclassified Arsukibacterium]MAA96136.1 hypothetical protein [Rheinheimera sp.]HAW94457.1 hypothetical protein [Candidatus Azambacteria bacterium]|tara:strand:- start:418 stop:1425 length:1008 start_codon:yes stop_codon:yes gene_type:complete